MRRRCRFTFSSGLTSFVLAFAAGFGAAAAGAAGVGPAAAGLPSIGSGIYVSVAPKNNHMNISAESATDFIFCASQSVKPIQEKRMQREISHSRRLFRFYAIATHFLRANGP